MKYFVLKQDKQVVEIKGYLKRPGIDKDFARFIHREALLSTSNFLQHPVSFRRSWDEAGSVSCRAHL
jgi:hypothetical protein